MTDAEKLKKAMHIQFCCWLIMLKLIGLVICIPFSNKKRLARIDVRGKELDAEFESLRKEWPLR